MARSQNAYLFSSEATISDVVEHVRRQLLDELEHIDSSKVLATNIDDLVNKLVDEYRLKVPVIKRDATHQLPNEEVDIDVSCDPNRIFMDRGPHYVKGTALRIGVPFEGDPNLFKYPSSSFGGLVVEAEVVEDTVVLTYRAEHPDAAVAKRDFDARLGQIENTLNFLRGKTEEWNTQLPDVVRRRITERRTKLERDKDMSLGYPMAPPKPKPSPPAPVPSPARRPAKAEEPHYDLFLSHASEDKAAIARPLYEALTAKGVTVWFDEAVLEMGDSLRRKIDAGLAHCTYGVVILSPNFFAVGKEWTQRELDGLVTRETTGSHEKAILPIWHDITKDEIAARSPTLADRVAGRSTDGVPALVDQILRVLKRK